MRKITQEACAEFMDGHEYHNDNTTVVCRHDLNYDENVLILHGHEIAKRIIDSCGKEKLYVRTDGWDTVTTRERLNGIPGVRVYHKNKTLYLNDKLWENHQDWTLVK